MAPPAAVLAAFGAADPGAGATLLTAGHIHETWLVRPGTGDDAPAIVLQRLNRDVFADVDAVVANVRSVTDHLRRRCSAAPPGRGHRDRWEILTPVPTRDGTEALRLASGEVWRATRRIEATHTRHAPAGAGQATAAGRAYGRFIADLADLDPASLRVTIPDFHDLGSRQHRLVEALARDRVGRAASVRATAATALELAAQIDDGRSEAGADAHPARVVHNDAKIDNLLFDDVTGEPVAVIDLDTVMPGRILDDFGELVRSAASTAAEDEPAPDRVDVDHDLAAALGRGFVAGVAGVATPAELATLAWGPPSMAVENALRFLTDHVDGDRYYRISRPDHNLDRARAQLALAARLLATRDRLAAALGA